MDALAGIAQPELREIVLFVRAQAAPVSADDVAARFRIHRTVARSRLERLAAAGLLTVAFERRTGRSGPGAGRPTKLYAAAPETSALEFPQRHYERLLGHLVAALPGESRNVALTQVGVDFGHDLVAAAGVKAARGIHSAARRACAALGELGFQAAVTDTAPNSVTITTPTCPLRPLVVANPQAAAIDRGMWIGLVDAVLPRRSVCAVCCEAEGCLDDHASCRVRLDFRPEDRKTSRQS